MPAASSARHTVSGSCACIASIMPGYSQVMRTCDLPASISMFVSLSSFSTLSIAAASSFALGGLASDGASGFENPCHDGGIEFRDITFKQCRAVHHWDAGDTDVILDRDLLAAQ